MHPRVSLLALLFLASTPTGCAPVGVSGADYAPTYDYSEFFAVADGKTFQVIVDGTAFPDLPADEMRRRLLPVMQANRPGARLTFTYAAPAERPRPYYRAVLVFDAANDLTAARVCNGEIRHRPQQRGRLDLFAVYCRNDAALSQVAGNIEASSPEDPRVGQLFARIFLELFTPFPPNRHRPRPFLWP